MIAGNDPFLSAREVFLENNGGSSNGAVMRGPPIGIMYGVTEVTEYSAICAALTHKNPVTIACSIWVNHMISGLCRGKGKKSAFLHAHSSCTESEVIRVLGSFEQFPIAPLLDALAATHAALLIFMQCSSFEETILRAIYSGGDADTVACISGALAGAFYGLDAVPAIWIEKIHRYQQIISLSQSLWSISHP